MKQRVPARRIVGLVSISVSAGAMLGFVAASLCAPIGGPFGLVGGSVIGLVVSPVLVLSLGRKHLLPGVAIVVGPALVTAIMGGLAQNPSASLLSVVVFVAMALVSNLALKNVVFPLQPGVCARCGYETSVLHRCPECGLDVGAQPDQSLPSRARGRLVIALVIVFGVVGPLLGLTIWAARERNRSHSTAELIERLGANDMQLQWEARDQLSRQGSAPLIQALRHPKAGVRRNAAWALESLRDPAAKDELKRLLNDPDPWTRDHAKKALDALPPE